MDLHMPYSKVLARMTLSDLAKYSMTQSIAQSLRQLSFLYSTRPVTYVRCQSSPTREKVICLHFVQLKHNNIASVELSITHDKKKCWADCTVFAMRLPSGQTLQTALSHILSGPLFTLSHKTSITCQCSILTIAS